MRPWIRDLGHRVWLAVAIIVGGEALILGGGLFTRKGIRLMPAQPGPRSLEASALLGGTLVHLSGSLITEPEVLAYFDALQPVEPDELEFKRG